MYTDSLQYLKRCWAEIDLDALSYNLHQVQSWLPKNTHVMAVVKADAYGHGDRMVSKTLLQEGVKFLAVSNIDEAAALREDYVDEAPLITSNGKPPSILILGYTPTEHVDYLYSHDICQTVFSIDYAHALNAACSKLGAPIRVHIKIDTGMNRLGILQDEVNSAAELVSEIISLPFLKIEGIFTHMSSADSLEEGDIEYTRMQVERFSELKRELDRLSIDIPQWHLQNSAGIAFIDCEEPLLSIARAGIVLYGVQPGITPLPFEVKPVMSIKAVISHIKELPEGQAVSYGRKYVTSGTTKVATVPIGYADGYFRALSNKSEVIVGNKRVPVIGNICMDQLMLDVTSVTEIAVGDEVALVGSVGGATVTFLELAELASTIPYELMCAVCKRVPRVYVKNGKEVAATSKRSCAVKPF